MKKQLQKGFTLIELMIVVAIIGILASIALPAYQDYIARSQMTEAVTIMSAQKATIAEIYADEGVLTNADNTKQGLPAKTDMAGKYLKQVDIVNGVMTATMNSTGVSKGIKSKKLTMAPTANANGIITWKCGKSGDAPNKYLPKACRY